MGRIETGVRFLIVAGFIAVFIFSGRRSPTHGASFFLDEVLASEADELKAAERMPESGTDDMSLSEPADDAPFSETEYDTPLSESAEYVPQVEEVHITVPGMDGSCSLLWISDLHICSGADDPGVSAEHREEVRERYGMLQNQDGRSARETWKKLSGQIDSFGADYVIFGADLVDYASKENLECLQAGLEKVRTPWMYLRADHDYGRWFGSLKLKRMRKLHRKIAPQNSLWVERFEEFTLAGLDNTTTAIAQETLDAFRRLCGEGRPIILCTHVPFDTGSEDAKALAELSREGWGDRVLCWGSQDAYDTSSGGTMKELMDLICAPDSVVCAVLAGHLHLSWEGALTDRCVGHVFSAAYEDHIGLITVSGS